MGRLAHLGASWGVLGRLGGGLGRLGGVVGDLGAILGVPWGGLEVSGSVLGAFPNDLRRVLRLLARKHKML